jgi:hypothetical protein
MRDLRLWMAILFIIGLAGLFPTLRARRFDFPRMVDVLRLIASIGCLVAALIMLVITIRRN